MFEKNDKIYYFWEKFIKVLSIVLICLTVLAGIIIASRSEYLIVYGLLLIFIGPLIILLNWAFFKLIFSYLRDIKYIRNKLYWMGAENEIANEDAKGGTTVTNDDDKTSKLEQLKDLLDSGVITREEYEAQISKI